MQTLRANFPRTKVLQREVDSLTGEDVGDVALIVAGPPWYVSSSLESCGAGSKKS